MQYPTLFIGLGGTGEKVLAQIKTILLDNSLILGPYRFLCIDVDESGRYREERLTKPLESFREFLNIGFYYPTFIEKVCEQDSYFNKWWYDCKEWLFFQRTSGSRSGSRSGRDPSKPLAPKPAEATAQASIPRLRPLGGSHITTAAPVRVVHRPVPRRLGLTKGTLGDTLGIDEGGDRPG
jgi:hypothetical protein